MRAAIAANAFQAWAQENRLMNSDFPVQIASQVEERDEVFDALKISAASESILRSKHLAFVGFNDARNEVIAFTNKVITAKDQKILPQTFGDEVTVRYVQGGLASAGVPSSGCVNEPYTLTSSGKYSCGSSVHPARHIGAGTLGALVRDQSGTLFGLSNNHVSGLCSYASEGEKILAPGHPDILAGGLDPFTIGYHHKSLPLIPGTPDNVNIFENRDAAIFKIANADWVSSMQGALYDTPSTIAAIQPGQAIEKVGRTTGHTKGTVICQMVGAFSCNYIVPGIGASVAFFSPVFVAQGIGGAVFSEPGDSGSIVVAELDGDRFAVGLLFAGDKSGHTFILPLEPILTNLGVTLVSGHNV